MDNPGNFISLNGQLIPEEEATIPAVSSGLFYGAGCFETFLSEKGSIFKFEKHIERLKSGLKFLGIEDEEVISKNDILDQIKNLLERNDQLEKRTRIRIQVSLNEKSGYSFTEDLSISVIITSSASSKKEKPQRLILSETSVVPSSARPTQFKLSNMLHYRHAFREAEKKNADDAVLLNVGGFVAETSITNIFWKKENEIFTPSPECDILPGIMRHSIIEILREEMKFEVKENRYSLDELMEADSVWITNSAIDFVPVAKIEDVSFDTEARFFSDLRKHLSAFKKLNMTDV